MPPRGRWGKKVLSNQAGYDAAAPSCKSNVTEPAAEVPITDSVPWSVNASASVQELLPGFLHFKRMLPLACQQRLLDISCCECVPLEGASGGWYRQEGGFSKLNDGGKARFWDCIERFPLDFRILGEELAQIAGQRCSTHLAVPCSKFKACVGAINFYSAIGSLNWHADTYDFAKPDRPIVIASIGDAADFGYRCACNASPANINASKYRCQKHPDQSIRLESGDVVIFGGPARDLVHALLRVYPQTAPAELQFPNPPGAGRVSVTWRDVGPEDGLTFNSDERLGLTIVTENTLARHRKGPKAVVNCAQCLKPATRSWCGDDGQSYCFTCWKAWGG